MTQTFPMERDTVAALLPHAPPALLVDRILAFDGNSITTQVFVSPDWDVFRGHFPNRPILPGVLMIEMVAQTGALIGVLGDRVGDDSFLAFTGIDKARFRRPVEPPAIIELTVDAIGRFGSIHRFDFEASVDGASVASGSVGVSLPPADGDASS